MQIGVGVGLRERVGAGVRVGVLRNTLLIHYYTKFLQNGHFVLQISHQEQHLEKK